MRDLIKNPIWKESELGLPLPDSQHAVSVALPTWNDVIKYEEKDRECMNSLKSIYPRFGFNPLLKKLSTEILIKNNLKDYFAWPYPNKFIALKAKNYCDRNSKMINSFVKEEGRISYLFTTKDSTNYARIFWQHAGLGISSREAAINLGLESAPPEELVKESHSKIIERILRNTDTSSDLIYLTSSGMSALHTALEIIYKIFPKRPTLQIGFPYVDVLKLPKNIFYGSNLIVEENFKDIELEITKLKPAAIIIELPSNPMLKCTNIKKIATIASKLNIPIITDDTIGSNLNIDSIYHSDLVFTSLTKIFAGSGDIMGGSLIINPKSKWINELKNALNKIKIPTLSQADLIALELASRNIEERVLIQNDNCLKLKRRLDKHKSIKKVYHPESCQNFNSIRKKNGGYGCLLSFEIKGGIEKTKTFYDNLKISKGPSLGTKFTLVCPYVFLAHYNELSWAESFGIPSHLIRVSVGLENEKILWDIFSEALNK